VILLVVVFTLKLAVMMRIIARMIIAILLLAVIMDWLFVMMDLLSLMTIVILSEVANISLNHLVMTITIVLQIPDALKLVPVFIPPLTVMITVNVHMTLVNLILVVWYLL
jgi:hypothetical protein